MHQRSRRTREEITYEILLTLSLTHGCRVSHIMQKTRLNYYQAKNYLSKLIEKKYIIEKNGVHVLLDRGKHFIARYEALKVVNKI